MVLRLRQSLNCLQQSLHIQYDTFNNFMITIGFQALHVDWGLFVLHDMNQDLVVATVVVCVDDLLIIPNKGMIGQINNHMKMSFRIHDLGSASL